MVGCVTASVASVEYWTDKSQPQLVQKREARDGCALHRGHACGSAMVLVRGRVLLKNKRIIIGIMASKFRFGINIKANAAPTQSHGLRPFDFASRAVHISTKARATNSKTFPIAVALHPAYLQPDCFRPSQNLIG